jgi:hypothetical protein
MNSDDPINPADPAAVDTQSRPSRLLPWPPQAACCLVPMLAYVLVITLCHLAVKHDASFSPHFARDWPNHPTLMYVDRLFFSTESDRLLFDQLAFDDYSHGGLYFVGASLMRRSLCTWEWPEQDRAYAHNYAISGSSLLEQSQFLKFLVEKKGLLKAGGSKTAVAWELAFQAANESDSFEFHQVDDATKAWMNQRFLLRYNRQTGLDLGTHLPLIANTVMEERRAESVSNWLLGQSGLEVSYPVLEMQPKPDAATTRAYWLRRFGPDWKSSMDQQLAAMIGEITDLQQRGVHVVAVLMPRAGWQTGFEPSTRFIEKVVPMLKSKSVEIFDASQGLTEADFSDTSHLTLSGVTKIQPALLSVVESCRRTTRGSAGGDQP